MRSLLVLLLLSPFFAHAQDDFYQRQFENQLYQRQIEQRQYEAQRFEVQRVEQQRVRLEQDKQEQREADQRFDAQQRRLQNLRRPLPVTTPTPIPMRPAPTCRRWFSRLRQDRS